MKKLMNMLKSAGEWLKNRAINEASECETAENYIGSFIEKAVGGNYGNTKIWIQIF